MKNWFITSNLKKNCLIVSFFIVLFSLISISMAQAGCVAIKVQYQDGCPRSGADVTKISPSPTIPLGTTNETGWTDYTCGVLNPPGPYYVQATYGGSEFGPHQAELDVDSSGNGETTIQKNANYPSEPCSDSGCSGTTYCIFGVIKCGASCVGDAGACLDLGACQCRNAGTSSTYPPSCTIDKPKCCLLGSAKLNECNSDEECYSGWCCIKGWQSNCCMPPGYCGCHVTSTTTIASTSTTTTTILTSTTTTSITTTTTTVPTTTTTTTTPLTSTTTTSITTTTTTTITAKDFRLDISPNPAVPAQSVRATVSCFISCQGKTANIKYGPYKLPYGCSCTASISGCYCNLTALNPSSSPTIFTYYAQIDLNNNGTIDAGEESGADLTVKCGMVGDSCTASNPTCCWNYYCDSNGVCQRTRSRGGGCPVLKVWDGNGYKDIEKLGIHSDEGEDTSLSVRFTMQPKDGEYYIKLSEIWYFFWEGSHIDYVKLADKTGNGCKLISAIHNKKGDVLSALAKSDDIRAETKPGEEINLTFTGCSGEDIIFTIEGYNSIFRAVKLELSYDNLPLIIASIFASLILILVVFTVFKRTMKSGR